MRPLGNRLLVKPLTTLDALSSEMLILPGNRAPSFTDITKSEVVAVGQRFSHPQAVEVGSIVLHNNQMGLKTPDPELLLLDGRDVLGVVEEA